MSDKSAAGLSQKEQEIQRRLLEKLDWVEANFEEAKARASTVKNYISSKVLSEWEQAFIADKTDGVYYGSDKAMKVFNRILGKLCK